MPAADLTTCASLVVAGLNAATSFTATPSDPRYYTSQVSNTLLNLDSEIIKALTADPLHPRAKDFLTTQSAVVSGSQLTSRVGAIHAVIFNLTGGSWPYQTAEVGRLATPEEVRLDNLNPNGLTMMEPKWAILGDVIVHNKAGLEQIVGRTIRVDAIYPAYTRTAALQSPEEFSGALVRGALETLHPVEATNIGGGQHFGAGFTRDLSLIRANQPVAR